MFTESDIIAAVTAFGMSRRTRGYSAARVERDILTAPIAREARAAGWDDEDLYSTVLTGYYRY